MTWPGGRNCFGLTHRSTDTGFSPGSISWEAEICRSTAVPVQDGASPSWSQQHRAVLSWAAAPSYFARLPPRLRLGLIWDVWVVSVSSDGASASEHTCVVQGPRERCCWLVAPPCSLCLRGRYHGGHGVAEGVARTLRHAHITNVTDTCCYFVWHTGSSLIAFVAQR
jgi:hypothetical protein